MIKQWVIKVTVPPLRATTRLDNVDSRTLGESKWEIRQFSNIRSICFYVPFFVSIVFYILFVIFVYDHRKKFVHKEIPVQYWIYLSKLSCST